MKTSEMSLEKLLKLRESKKEASRRCRARAKAIAEGSLLTESLLLRSAQPKGLKPENFKFTDGTRTIRMSRNGGEKICITISDGITKTRKSFANIKEAVKAFKELVK